MRDPSSSIRARFAAENAFVLVPVLAMLAAAAHRKTNQMTTVDLKASTTADFFFFLALYI
jgi:hypothetical protein